MVTSRTQNPARERDMEIAKMLGMGGYRWQNELSPTERKMYRALWKKTPEQDRQMEPAAWQMKYLGCMYIRPPLQIPTGPKYEPDGCGNVKITYPDGREEVDVKCGTCKITTYPNGDREICCENSLFEDEEWIQIDRLNGDRISRRKNSTGQYIQQTEQPNGKIITIAYDGRCEIQYPNGAAILESPDGSVELRMDGKTIELAPVIPDRKDVQKNRRQGR